VSSRVPSSSRSWRSPPSTLLRVPPMEVERFRHQQLAPTVGLMSRSSANSKDFHHQNQIYAMRSSRRVQVQSSWADESMLKESRRAMCPRIWNRNQVVVRRSTSLISQEKIRSQSPALSYINQDLRVEFESSSSSYKGKALWRGLKKKRKLALCEVRI
jgi:hypothetical protein